MVSRNKESIISPKSQARWREIVGVLFIALSLFFLLSLVSYSPLDVSLNSTGTVKGVSNLGGVGGGRGRKRGAVGGVQSQAGPEGERLYEGRGQQGRGGDRRPRSR